MNTKMIAAAIGLFGGGVLFGWAWTADRWEKKVQEKDEYIDILRSKAKEETALPTYEELVAEKDRLIALGIDPAILDTPIRGEVEPQPVLFEVGGESEMPPGEIVVTKGVTEEEAEEVETEVIRDNLQKLINNYTEDKEEVDRWGDLTGRLVEMDNTPPYVISQEDFAYGEEGQDHSKVTLTYYPRHRIILEEDGDVLDDIANVVGWKNLSQFGGESGNMDVVYVRNRRLQIDYEIEREEEEGLPVWVKYGMDREEFEVKKASGLLRVREEDK